MRPHRAVLALLYAIAFLALAHYLAEGWTYYRTPLIERPHHPQFWSLKPGGTIGKAFVQQARRSRIHPDVVRVAATRDRAQSRHPAYERRNDGSGE